MFNRNDPERSKWGRGANLQVYDMKGVTPFSGQFTADKPAVNNKHRLKVFRKFFSFDKFPEHLKVLDVGKSNFIARHLGITHNTIGDLNNGIKKIIIQKLVTREVENPKLEDSLWVEKIDVVNAEPAQYDVITNFEVFNHMMNGLLFLQDCNRLLKMGGKMYLSTPLLWGVALSHGRGNYMELPKDRVLIILQYCGFKPIRYRRENPWPFRFIFYGFRPPFRWLLNRFQLWEFKKVSEVK